MFVNGAIDSEEREEPDSFLTRLRASKTPPKTLSLSMNFVRRPGAIFLFLSSKSKYLEYQFLTADASGISTSPGCSVTKGPDSLSWFDISSLSSTTEGLKACALRARAYATLRNEHSEGPQLLSMDSLAVTRAMFKLDII